MEAIVVCPQCPSGQQWVDTPWGKGNYSIADVPVSNELDAVLGIMTNTIADLSVDTDRLYLMGLSMGGFGVWDLLMRNPTVFAGAVAMCGGADPSQASSLTTVPIWAVHGKNDNENNVVPYTGTEEMCNAIIEAGGEVCIKEIKEGFGHNVWGYVGASAEIATWLFEQSK
jgi:predicted peptidase